MLSVGLVGLPNAGKSSLFNLLTKRSVPAENFPFCTIDPHDGIVEVPDHRIDTIAKICNSQKKVNAVIEFRDIAGLVKNASSGEGLGNQFLSHILEVDLILMVVRCFRNDDIIHVENRVHPTEDEEILLMELTLHDQSRLEKMLPKIEKEARTSQDARLKLQIVEEILNQLSQINPAKDYVMDAMWDPELVKWRKNLNLITDKPILRLANVTHEGDNLPYHSDFELDILLESTMADMTPEERVELGINPESGLDKLIRACYNKLELATYLTGGEKEARAWTFTKGMKAPECAGKIHTDFTKKFVKAEVVNFKDFVEAEGWKGSFEKGVVKTMGKDYVMEDGDVVEFKIAS